MHCSIIAPAFLAPDSSSIKQICTEKLGTDNIELFALVPLAEAPHCMNIAIRMAKCPFSLASLEELLAQREILTYKLGISADSLSECTKLLKDYSPGKLEQLEKENSQLKHLLK